MKVLIADSDPFTRRSLQSALATWDYEAVVAEDGEAVWTALQAITAPRLLILDWRMPKPDGTVLCQRVRSLARPAHVILLTSRKEDLVLGLEAGADAGVARPLDWRELRAHIRNGCQIVRYQSELETRLAQLDLVQARELPEVLPICSCCKKIRDGENHWREIEQYLARNTDVRCSHSVCPGCLPTLKEKLQRS
jgi:DNA-binding response OmpR family regulator